MQLNKKFISLLAGISLVALGILTSCGQPSDPTSVDEPEKIEGIKLDFNDVPANTKHIRVLTWIGSRDYTLVDVNDLAKYKYVVDENVTPGQEYEYRIGYFDNNWNWIKNSEWFKVTAESGKGELTFKTQVNENGIKFSDISIDYEDIDFINIEKFYDNTINRINVYKPDDGGTFTDKYVENGKTYEYLLRVQMGTNGYIDDDKNEIPADPIVKYPRFKSVSVTATAGSGSITTSVLPIINYDPTNKKFKLIQKPEFSEVPDSWSLFLNYKKTNEGYYQFVSFFNDDNQNTVKTINENIPAGLWSFGECWFKLQFDQYSYEYGEYTLTGVPETIPVNVNVENLFMPLATPTDDGIKIEWRNLPENTKILEVRDAKNGNTLFEINDLTTITSVTDKYVTKGSRYEYYLIAKYENGNLLQQSDFVSALASAGQNERTVTILATDTGIKISGEKTTGNSYFEIDRFIKGENRNQDSYTLNVRSEQSDTSYELTDIFVNKGQEYEYRIYERIGFHSRTIGGDEIPPDLLIEYPRYTNVFVKATGGSGPVQILNEPEATFTDGQVNFSIKPKIQYLPGIGYWNFEFNYHCKTLNRNWSLYGYWANIIKDEVWNNTQNAPSGTWELEQYWINLAFETYSYTQYNNNLEKLSKLPEITL